jgi:hypothetical protein
VDILTQLAWTILGNGHLPDPDDKSEDEGGQPADDGGQPAGEGGQPTGASTGEDTSDGPSDDTSTASSSDGSPNDCRCGGGNRAARRSEQKRRRRLARRHRRTVTVNVTVPLTTLLGLDERPAELEGYGPITAETARRIAAHGTWRRLLTDPDTGAVLDYGTTRYEPPPDLVEHVHARDQSCRFPTCARPARLCQDDHTIPAGAPGWTTSNANLGPLSAGCHNAKPSPAGGWTNPNPADSSGPPPPATATSSTPNKSDPSSPPPTPTHPSTTSNQNGQPRTPTPTHHQSD